MAIHLFNPLWDASGGSEWRTLSLFKVLSDHAEVGIWTEYAPDARLLGQYPIREMLKARTFPQSGTFVFIGVYWEIGAWLKQAKPDRVILTYNVVDEEGLGYRLEQLKELGIENVELRFASELMAQHAGGRTGTVEFSPIDFENLIPKSKLAGGKIVIHGRHSRDQRFKHHPDDPELYRRLVDEGFEVRLMGGTCLTELEGAEGIQLLPVNSQSVPEFLQGIDIFFYRTDPGWTEAYGRVLAEAMACGLPCVAEGGAGYDDLIQSGKNGFLFSNGDEAHEILLHLRDDPELRKRVGEAAHKSITELYESETRKLIEYYLR